MLQIKTTNGNTLVHADQRPDTYNGRSYDGSQYMVHAGEWGRHKYIRKEGNRYIYPEDLQKKASAGLHKVAKTAKDIYEDRGTYAKAAKDMAGDLKNAAERRKYRIKDEMRKQYDERKAKEDHIKERNAKMAEGAKKIVKGMWDSSKIGRLVNLGKESAENINSLANSGKNEEVAERSMPNSKKNVGKKPLSRKKKVVEGRKEIKKNDKLKETTQREKDKKFVSGTDGLTGTQAYGVRRNDQMLSAHKVALNKKSGPSKSDGSTPSFGVEDSRNTRNKTESQIRSAHKGDTSRTGSNTTSNLEIQKDKTKARKIIAENKNKTDVQAANAHRGANDPRRKMKEDYKKKSSQMRDDYEKEAAQMKAEFENQRKKNEKNYAEHQKKSDEQYNQTVANMEAEHKESVRKNRAKAEADYAKSRRKMKEAVEAHEKEVWDETIARYPIKGRVIKGLSDYTKKKEYEAKKKRRDAAQHSAMYAVNSRR